MAHIQDTTHAQENSYSVHKPVTHTFATISLTLFKQVTVYARVNGARELQFIQSQKLSH